MYIHCDGLQISISDSIALLQESTNDDIQDTIKLLTNDAGCFTDSFSVTETLAPVNSNSPKALAIRIGKIVFPSGEVYLGDNFLYQLPIYESQSNQYLIATYQPLKEEKAEYLCDSVEEYYFRRNGIKLELQNNFVQTNLNQSVLAMVTFFPGERLVISDWRQMFTPYYKAIMPVITGASVSEQYEVDYTLKSRFPFNIEGRVISRYLLPARSMGEYKIKHEILNDTTKIAQIDNYICNAIEANNFMAPISYTLGEFLPAGLCVETYIKSISPYDANNESEWLALDERTVGEDSAIGTITPEISWCKNIPAFTYRLVTADGQDGQSYGQVWFSTESGLGGGQEIDITKSPIAENKIAFSGGSAGVPGNVLFFPRENDDIKLAARMVGDGNKIGSIGGGASETTSTLFTEPILLKIPFRGHGEIDSDYAPQRWYSCVDGSVPVFQLHNPSSKTMCITRVDITNYAESGAPKSSTLYINDVEICDVDEAANATPVVPFTDSATGLEIFITDSGGRGDTAIFYITSTNDYIDFDGEMSLHVCYYR